jgi:hypothetical protein
MASIAGPEAPRATEKRARIDGAYPYDSTRRSACCRGSPSHSRRLVDERRPADDRVDNHQFTCATNRCRAAGRSHREHRQRLLRSRHPAQSRSRARTSRPAGQQSSTDGRNIASIFRSCRGQDRRRRGPRVRSHPLVAGNWVRHARADRTKGKTGLTTEERAELAALRKENRELRTEREILKKAAAFFAKHQQ